MKRTGLDLVSAPMRSGELSVVEVLETEIAVMGTVAHVLVVEGSEHLLHGACERLLRLERLLSRFRPDSEVARVNASPGKPVQVSAETLEVVRRAQAARSTTGGLFDPLVGANLAALGYDRSFEDIRGRTLAIRSLDPPRRELVVDESAGTVTIPTGTALDLGGIAKGWAADDLCRLLLQEGAAGASVSIGGDVRCLGMAPDPVNGWVVEIRHGIDPTWGDHHPQSRTFEHVRDVVLPPSGGALATSTVLRRWWKTEGGGVAHHLVDPRTGRPAVQDTATVTVVAPDCTDAEVYTKVSFLGGSLPPALGALKSSFEGRLTCLGPLVPLDGETLAWRPRLVERVGPFTGPSGEAEGRRWDDIVG